MRNIIKWKLQKIKFHSLYSEIMNQVFSSRVLKTKFLTLHKRALYNRTRFKNMDKKTDSARFSFWCRRLYALKNTAQHKSYTMRTQFRGVDGYENIAADYWLMSNCMPACGQWKPANRRLTPTDPTGHPCRMWACPWCHIRRLTDIYRIIAASSEKEVKLFERRIVSGLGIGKQVNLLLFAYTKEYKDGDPEHIFTSSENMDIHVRKIDTVVRRLGKFTKAMRIMYPVMTKTENGYSLGLNIGYIFSVNDKPVRAAVDISSPAYTKIELIENLKLSKALTIAAPYSTRLIEPKEDSGDFGPYFVERAMYKRRTYGCINLPTIRVLPETSVQKVFVDLSMGQENQLPYQSLCTAKLCDLQVA